MRDNYLGKAGTDESRAATTRLMSTYCSGIKIYSVFDAKTSPTDAHRAIQHASTTEQRSITDPGATKPSSLQGISSNTAYGVTNATSNELYDKENK